MATGIDEFGAISSISKAFKLINAYRYLHKNEDTRKSLDITVNDLRKEIISLQNDTFKHRADGWHVDWGLLDGVKYKLSSLSTKMADNSTADAGKTNRLMRAKRTSVSLNYLEKNLLPLNQTVASLRQKADSERADVTSLANYVDYLTSEFIKIKNGSRVDYDTLLGFERDNPGSMTAKYAKQNRMSLEEKSLFISKRFNKKQLAEAVGNYLASVYNKLITAPPQISPQGDYLVPKKSRKPSLSKKELSMRLDERVKIKCNYSGLNLYSKDITTKNTESNRVTCLVARNVDDGLEQEILGNEHSDSVFVYSLSDRKLIHAETPFNGYMSQYFQPEADIQSVEEIIWDASEDGRITETDLMGLGFNESAITKMFIKSIISRCGGFYVLMGDYAVHKMNELRAANNPQRGYQSPAGQPAELREISSCS